MHPGGSFTEVGTTFSSDLCRSFEACPHWALHSPGFKGLRLRLIGFIGFGFCFKLSLAVDGDSDIQRL